MTPEKCSQIREDVGGETSFRSTLTDIRKREVVRTFNTQPHLIYKNNYK